MIGFLRGSGEPGKMIYYIWAYHYLGYHRRLRLQSVLESCRIASDTRVNLKHVFTAIITSMIIFVVLGLILPLHAYHIWGTQKYVGNP